jgi:anti-sigma factor RsiW
MTAERPIGEEDLHAYVDKALDQERADEVRRYLDQHPDIAARIEGFAAQRLDLRAALAPIAGEPIPARLSLQRIIETRRRVRTVPWRAVAAALVAAMLGGISGWSLHDVSMAPQGGIGILASEAAENYRVYAADRTRPVEMGPAERKELVSWVSGRLKSPVAIPDLSAAGYRFMGGRLVATPHGPAAMFLYDGVGDMPVAVLVRPMATDKNTGMSEHEDGEIGGVTWADKGIGYSLVGTESAGKLHPIANEVRRQTRAEVLG